MTYDADAAERSAGAIRMQIGGDAPVAGIVLGSGLGGLAQRIEGAVRVPYADIPGFPAAAVAGHDGVLIAGTLAGRRVLCLAGRIHMYEGYSAALVGFPVRVLHALGATTLFLSNAAGGIRRTFVAGDLMMIADHINLMWANPLIGPLLRGDERFPDMSAPYDPGLCALLQSVAQDRGIALHAGVYAALMGPTYETPAEVRMLERLGADAVGMSTVPEVLVARAIGVRVAGVSLITNVAAGMAAHPLTHTDVVVAGGRAAEQFEALVTGFVAAL